MLELHIDRFYTLALEAFTKPECFTRRLTLQQTIDTIAALEYTQKRLAEEQ